MFIPIFHIHVKCLDTRKHKGDWFALFLDHQGSQIWMQQPCKMAVGSEQVLYVIKSGTDESDQLSAMIEHASREEIEKFLIDTAKKYGEWCERTFDQAVAIENGPQVGTN